MQLWESLAVGYDGAKQIKGRKRHLTVDTLGLILRVWVSAASVPEREGGRQVLNKVKQMGKAMSRLHTIWVDGGYDGEPFMQWVMDTCRWIVQVVLRPQECKGFVLLPKRDLCGTDVRLALLVSAVEQRLLSLLPETAETFIYLARDPRDAEAIGIKFDPKQLFKHPLRYSREID